MLEPTAKKPRRPNAPPGWRDKFIATLRETGNVAYSCSIAVVRNWTAYRARRDHPNFAAQWDDALAEACGLLEEEARRRATEGIARPVFHDGKRCGEIQVCSDRLLIFLLKAHNPARFRENYHMEVAGKDGRPIETRDVTGLSDAELELIASGGRAGAAAAPRRAHKPD